MLCAIEPLGYWLKCLRLFTLLLKVAKNCLTAEFSCRVCLIIVLQFDVDEFVSSHLNEHRKGLLGRQLSAEALLTFSKVML